MGGGKDHFTPILKTLWDRLIHPIIEAMNLAVNSSGHTFFFELLSQIFSSAIPIHRSCLAFGGARLALWHISRFTLRGSMESLTLKASSTMLFHRTPQASHSSLID